MQSLASRPIAAPYEPLIARLLVSFAQSLRGALGEYLASWRQRLKFRRGELPDRLNYMGARMLKDVGAPDWMIDRAIERQQMGIFH